jgi:hypothetical protein
MDAIWTPLLGWMGAAGAAVALALAAPHEQVVLGKLPPLTAKRLDQTQVLLPQELPSGRTLALVTFDRSQREEARSWIEGLQLHRQADIAWVKLPVIADPGDEDLRRGILQRLRERHAARPEHHARLVPVFTDRAAFVRSAGLSSAQHASVLILDREGRVLARAEGAFDPAKAEALRETVLAQGD